MTRREKMAAVFERRYVPRPPVSVRLDLWYADMKVSNRLPGEIRGLSCEEVEDYLGFCRAARYRMNPHLRFNTVEIRENSHGGERTQEYLFPGRTLVRRTSCSEEMQRRGMLGHITKYPLETEADYDLLLRHMDSASLEFRVSDFGGFASGTGSTGLPLMIAGACPAHLVMLEFSGYEGFYCHRADFGGKVDALIRQLEEIYRRDLWPVLCGTDAELVLHGTHFSSQMTPRPVFEKYFVPYFSEFNRLMHGCGKKVLWHADAEMGELLGHVLEAGFDGADCLATKPLVPQAIEDYFSAWQGKIVCWGGLPGIIFGPEFPAGEFRRHVQDLVLRTRGRNDFIFGVSDNVMPGAEWERLKFLSEATGSRD